LSLVFSVTVSGQVRQVHNEVTGVAVVEKILTRNDVVATIHLKDVKRKESSQGFVLKCLVEAMFHGAPGQQINDGSAVLKFSRANSGVDGTVPMLISEGGTYSAELFFVDKGEYHFELNFFEPSGKKIDYRFQKVI
jgi:sugar phosphate isomerase/epimerase